MAPLLTYPKQLRNNLPSGFFESLIPEIKIEILRVMPDIRTLSALVHASPSFHAAYQTVRPEILTTRRGVYPYTPCCFAQVTLRRTKYHPYYQPQSFPYTQPADSVIAADKAAVSNIQRILRLVWTRLGAGAGGPKLNLCVADCVALLQIVRYTGCPLLCGGEQASRQPLGWVYMYQDWFQRTEGVRTHQMQPKEVMHQHLLVFVEPLAVEEARCIENLYERKQMWLFRQLSDLAVYGRDKYIN